MSRAKTQEEYIAELRDRNIDVEPMEAYIDCQTKIAHRHNKCMHICQQTPSDVLSGYGCGVCNGKQVLIGFNDMWATRPDVARLLKNPEDGYKYTAMSNKSTAFICPCCKTEIYKPIHKVSSRGLSCKNCGDGISFPNKFARALLQQLPVDRVIYEWTPIWLRPYKFDNYFEYGGQGYVLEMDGRTGHGYNQHETPRNSGLYGEALDSYKDELAERNNIKVIRIDCAYRDTVNRDLYIKNHILDSMLCCIFDLSNILWDKCNRIAMSSMVQIVSKMFDGGMSVLEISKITQYNRTTVKNWLKQGSKIGMNTYSIEESRIRGCSMREDVRKSISIIKYSKDMKIVEIYPSATQAGIANKCSSAIILRHCRGKRHEQHLYKDYFWYCANNGPTELSI